MSVDSRYFEGLFARDQDPWACLLYTSDAADE